MRAKRPRFQAVCGSRARQGDGRSTAETPALPAGVRLAGETPTLPGGARRAGETGVGESDRRAARAPRRCAARGRATRAPRRCAARGRDRGTGDRPPRRPRPQAVRGRGRDGGRGDRPARRPRSQAVQGRAVFQRTRTIPERRQVAPTGMHALDHDVISGVTRPTARAAFPPPLRRQRPARFDASGAPAPRGSAIRPETAQTRQHPHPGRRTASPDRQCP